MWFSALAREMVDRNQCAVGMCYAVNKARRGTSTGNPRESPLIAQIEIRFLRSDTSDFSGNRTSTIVPLCRSFR